MTSVRLAEKDGGNAEQGAPRSRFENPSLMPINFNWQLAESIQSQPNVHFLTQSLQVLTQNYLYINDLSSTIISTVFKSYVLNITSCMQDYLCVESN